MRSRAWTCVSQGWEYASEMVLKCVHMGLRTTEVPIHFLKDPEGRLSHMKRRGWLEPWRAGCWSLASGSSSRSPSGHSRSGR